MKRFLLSLIAGGLVFTSMVAENPKREFRGAWMHTVFQGQYAKQSTTENKAYLMDQLDKLQAAGVNAIVFQVRPQADAFYNSNFEPWSRFLSGTAGVAPSPAWDPLQFMIEQSHARGMELHAWLNPYRVTTSKGEKLPKDHIYYKHPERFVEYDGKKYFDPGVPENREFIENVVKDIITKYDVDAIHMDDYFYPYPVAGVDFPDGKSFAKNNPNGLSRGDWRRENVNLLIKEIHESIETYKPWVRFGISPFGIWRNKAKDPRGSESNGLQNYDELYADVILWTEQGWVDYMVPQLYWALDHPRAASLPLAYWWNDYANNRHMYIGQSVNQIMDTPDIAPSKDKNELAHKIGLTRELPNLHGSCWWPGYSITNNYKRVADSLANNQQSTIALIPVSTWIDNTPPAEVVDLNGRKNDNEVSISWSAPATDDKMQEARFYVVYKFTDGAEIDLENSAAIVSLSDKTEFREIATNKSKATYVITVLDRLNNESAMGRAIEL
ncbi:MAG: family 10 glycosylhydrolase [Bacteroidales bacterium]